MRLGVNLLIVFALCGFWHGAGWVFLIWGLYHGAFLVLERFIPKFPNALPRFLQHLYTLVVIMFGWVIFRSADLSQLTGMTLALLGMTEMGPHAIKVWVHFFAYDVYIALLLGVILSTPIFPLLSQYIKENYSASANVAAENIGYLCALLLLLICYMPLFGSTYNSFIYFRF